MIKLILVLCVFFNGICCRTSHSMTKEEYMESFSKADFHPIGVEEYIKINKEKMQSYINEEDAFRLFDVNDDSLISSNEIRIFVRDYTAQLNLTNEEKILKQQKIYAFFKQADLNHDDFLDASEIVKFWNLYIDDEFRDKFIKSDINKNGVFDREDILTEIFLLVDCNHDGVFDDTDLSLTTNELESAIENMSNNMDMIVNNLSNSTFNNFADEEYFLMDTNKDGCVDKDEYSHYQYNQEKKEPIFDEEMPLSFYVEFYSNIKKENADCLLKDEYIAFSNNIVHSSVELETLDDE